MSDTRHPPICMCPECQRIAKLEAENERLTTQLDAGIEAGWHALRAERDLLAAARDTAYRKLRSVTDERDRLLQRIDEAPEATLVCGQGGTDTLMVLSAEDAANWAGQCVRLVTACTCSDVEADAGHHAGCPAMEARRT